MHTFWPHKDMECLPGWGISSKSGPPPRQHKHERRYTPFTHPFILTRWIWRKGYDGQMMFGDLVGLKLPDILSYWWGKTPKKNITQESSPDRGSNPGPLSDRQACNTYLLAFIAKCQSLILKRFICRPTSSGFQMIDSNAFLAVCIRI